MNLEAKTNEVNISLDRKDMQIIAKIVADTINSNGNGKKHATMDQVVSSIVENNIYKNEREAIRAVMLSASSLDEYNIKIKCKDEETYFVMR